MSLIGILTQKSHEAYIKQENSITQEQIFFLKEESLSNLKNIQFQTILIGKKITQNKEQVKEIARKAKYLIFNTDIPENLDLLEDMQLELITYGFNSKATITTSSIEDSKIMVCLQRTLQNVQGKKIEPQELRLYLSDENNSYAVMELKSLEWLYGGKDS